MDPNAQYSHSLVPHQSHIGISTEWRALEISPELHVQRESSNTTHQPLGIFSDAANAAIAIVEGSRSGRLTPILDDLFSARRSPASEDESRGKRRKHSDKSADIPGYSCFNLNGEPCEAPSGKGRKGPLNKTTRKKVATVRALGACYRCRWQKKPVRLLTDRCVVNISDVWQCSGGRPCGRCLEAVSSKKQSECLRWMDCFVLSLLDINPCVFCWIGDTLPLNHFRDVDDPRSCCGGGPQTHQEYLSFEGREVLQWLEAKPNIFDCLTLNAAILCETLPSQAFESSNPGQRQCSLGCSCCNTVPLSKFLPMLLAFLGFYELKNRKTNVLSIESPGGTVEDRYSLSKINSWKSPPLSPCRNTAAIEHLQNRLISSLILSELEKILQPSSLRDCSQESAMGNVLIIALILWSLALHPGDCMNYVLVSYTFSCERIMIGVSTFEGRSLC
jgi:hypothetical protein